MFALMLMDILSTDVTAPLPSLPELSAALTTDTVRARRKALQELIATLARSIDARK